MDDELIGMKMDMTTAKGKTTEHYMWMWFHTKLQDTVLFSGWNVTDVGSLLWTCAIIIVAGILVESIKYLRFIIQKKQKKSRDPKYINRLFSGAHFAQTLLFLLQLGLGYMLMLIFMTFSIWLGLAVCIGLTAGYLIFGYHMH
ncbi:unnamed protein product [Caenorhabditis bovis]|uniref:Copper transport protein n=1 Tax=Caenorhabditis bovis TaxID=2654633 RepID=A0A8S1F2H8_9PELO|nr:unnamed protein product [Caenorhabditis bovis]